ncbi:hypothetical protein N7462_001903 [Penicillium macrosclerotiorum]|uniref:uncharacterized protein n=1 Tax=Penicillium macrosclerotiorum TaxID=303699 RepID=UPI0025480BAC|nr:uncharacterized protein N7462_001903 [Penicillium macrosclerotiorum]KAJ5692480.1 hypothetical protein N7462_001903 [Penicillium macrosclerotiorum]
MTLGSLARSTQQLHEAVRDGATWGYVIYRTTYTSQSDGAFPQFLDLLNSSIKHELFSPCATAQGDIRHAPDATTCNEIWAQYQPIVMAHQAQFNRASVDSLRLHFQSWVKAREGRNNPALYRTCIVFDEESLQAFLEAPPSTQIIETNFKKPFDAGRFVKVISASAEAEEFDGFLGAEYPNEHSDGIRMDLTSHERKHTAAGNSDSEEYDGFMGG